MCDYDTDRYLVSDVLLSGCVQNGVDCAGEVVQVVQDQQQLQGRHYFDPVVGAYLRMWKVSYQLDNSVGY